MPEGLCEVFSTIGKAGGSAADGLYVSKGGTDQEVADDEVVSLKNGEHFTLIPNGRVS